MLPLDLAVYTSSPRSKAATTPPRQDFAASAEDPKKLAKVKGSNHASEAGFCCFRRRPEETRQGQRQQPCLRDRILLPLPKTRRNSPRSKAATTPQRQDFAASAEDVKKPTKAKGSKILNLERECCFRPRGGFWVLIMPG